MLKGKLTHVALAAVLAMLPFFVSWGFASQADDKRAELNEVQSQMQKMQDRRISTLSGGEFQRVRIARSLAQQTKYIFLDEPLTALDITFQKELLNILKQLCTQGKTICLSIHDLNFASNYADSLLMLRQDGNGIFSGTPDELLQKHILSQVYGTDFSIFLHPVTQKKQIW